MDKFKNKYRNDSARLKNWDYGSPGFYFITICTQNRECYFGDIDTVPVPMVVGTQNFASLPPQHTGSMRYTEIGNIAHQYWIEIPHHFPFVEPDEFVIMPNHVHGILFFNKPDYHRGNHNTFGPQSQNLASVIRGYKAAVKKYATINAIEFAWQPRYHDHVIKSERRLEIIRKYIRNNPAKWLTGQSAIVSATQLVTD